MGYQRNDSFSMTLVTFIFGVMIFMLDAQCFNPMLPKSSTLGCHQRNGSLFDSKNTPTRIATHRRNSAFTGKSHRIHDEDKRNRSLFEYMALTKNSSFVQFVSPPAYSIKNSPYCSPPTLPQFSHHSFGERVPVLNTIPLLETSSVRTLVYFPRTDIRTSLGTLISAYIFSLLSGRVFVRFHGGPHRQILSQICRSFECPSAHFLDSEPWQGRHSRYRIFMRIFQGGQVYLGKGAPGGGPAQAAMIALYRESTVLWVSAGKPWDTFWEGNETLSSCVRGAMECGGELGGNLGGDCVRGKVLRDVLGKPRGELGVAVEWLFGLRDNLTNGSMPGGSWGSQVKFDLAVFVRGKDWEGSTLAAMNCSQSEAATCHEKVNITSGFVPHVPLLDCLDVPLRRFLLKEGENKTEKGFETKSFGETAERNKSILLMSDSPLLLPLWGKILEGFGKVYFYHPIRLAESAVLTRRIPLTLVDLSLLSRSGTLLQMGGTVDRLAVVLGNLSVVLWDGKGNFGDRKCGFSVVRNGNFSEISPEVDLLRESFPPSSKGVPGGGLSLAEKEALEKAQKEREKRILKFRKDFENLNKSIADVSNDVSRLILPSHWPSPFVSLRGNFSLGSTKACGGLLSKEAYHPRHLTNPIQTLEELELTSINETVLVYFPRHGLGNSLRAFQSAFVFSVLSGRRLVLFKGGPHRQSLALLCRVFSCGADVITDVASWTSPRSMYRKFMKIYKKDELYPKYGPKYLSESLFSPKPILWVSTGAPFDSYWTTNSSLRDCTFSLLSCQNEWCVHSVALSEMVKSGPLDELGAVVEDEFRGVKSETGKNKRMNHLLPPGSGLNLWFDVGIHIRTLTMKLEKTSGAHGNRTCGSNDSECLLVADRLARRYLNHPFWECIGNYLSRKRTDLIKTARKTPSGLNIFLATDNEGLRDSFAEKLAIYGTVYHSIGSAAHTSKLSNLTQGLSSMAEFYLLGRSSELISFKKPFSTFASEAATLGNNSLAAFVHQNPPRDPCWFQFVHRGVDMNLA